MRQSLANKIDSWMDKKYNETFMERIELLFESEHMYEDLPYAQRYGKTLMYTVENMSLEFDEDELIIGAVAERIPSEQELADYSEKYRQWWDMSQEERQRQVLWYYSDGWLKCRAPWFISFGHLTFDWQGIIDEGLDVFIEKANKALDLEQNKNDQDKQDFLKGSIIVYKAIQRYIERHVEKVREIGNEPMAEMLSNIVGNKPETFQEALQLLWFVTIISQKVCGCGVLNYSRLDQYLYPLYKKGMADGSLNEQIAMDLIEEFFWKNNEIMLPMDHMSQETDEVKATLEVTYDDPNYLTVGGILADGTSGVNELSYLMVKANHDLGLRNPFMVVRYHDGIDEKFFENVVAAMRDNATFVIYNDETMIPALKGVGVEEPEVYDYGFFGCNDPHLGQYDGALRQFWFNLLRPVELVIHGGDYPACPKPEGVDAKDINFNLKDRMIGVMTGPYYGKKTDVDSIKNMDDFMAAYKSQVRYLLEDYREKMEQDFKVEQEANKGRLRFEDCFLDGTIENATTWNDGGTKYHKIIMQGCALANAVDSLYAIDKVVFQDKKMTLKELAALLADDYKSDDFFRQYLKRKVDKYGNDIDDVDKYVKMVVDIYCDEVARASDKKYLYQFWPTLSTDRGFDEWGQEVGATPDGRSAGEGLSENQSPQTGMDVNGVTALLNSVSKVPFDRITGGPLNLRFHPSAVKGENGLKALTALLKTYMQSRGMQVQMTVAGVEMLKEAQKEPENYKDLSIRVTGYSAYFVQMGKKAQDELISRTEQSI